MEDTKVFKIVGFSYFPNSEDVTSCIAVDDSGNEILIDPFVGCAWKYDNKEALLGTWFKADGHWHKSEKHNCPMCFLPREGCMKILQK